MKLQCLRNFQKSSPPYLKREERILYRKSVCRTTRRTPRPFEEHIEQKKHAKAEEDQGLRGEKEGSSAPNEVAAYPLFLVGPQAAHHPVQPLHHWSWLHPTYPIRLTAPPDLQACLGPSLLLEGLWSRDKNKGVLNVDRHLEFTDPHEAWSRPVKTVKAYHRAGGLLTWLRR